MLIPYKVIILARAVEPVLTTSYSYCQHNRYQKKDMEKKFSNHRTRSRCKCTSNSSSSTSGSMTGCAEDSKPALLI